MARDEVFRVYVSRGEARNGRARTVLVVLASALFLLATVSVVRRGGEGAVALQAGGTKLWSRGLASSYESDVFPAYHDSRLAPQSVLRSLDSHSAFASSVFPKYSAFVNGGDESGLGRSVLRRAQSDANRWMHLDRRDWQGRGSEYSDSVVRHEGRVQGELLAARGQVRVADGEAALARAEAAAAALSRPPMTAAEQVVRVHRPVLRALGATAPMPTDQKLYIPAIYNDKIDPEQEMEDMMEEFSDIIKQITELQAQMECAARCSNSTVNETTLDLDGNTLDVTFDDTHKNVSGGVLTPDEDDEASMACLKDCGIDEQILNATQQAETSTRSKLQVILKAVASEKAKMAGALSAARSSKQAAMLAAQVRRAPASASAHASTSPKEKTAALVKEANSFFGHTMANALQVKADAAAAKGHFSDGKWVDDGEVHAIEPRDRASVGSKNAKASAQALRHSFENRLSKSQSDAAARAWKPPPAPEYGTAVQVAPQMAVPRVASPEAAAARGSSRAWLSTASTRGVQSLWQVGARMAPSGRRDGAAKVQKWLGGSRTDGGPAQLVDWSLDLPGLDKLGVPAGSANTAGELVPPRDTIRHTAGRPGDVSRRNPASAPQNGAGRGGGGKGSGKAPDHDVKVFDGFL